MERIFPALLAGRQAYGDCISPQSGTGMQSILTFAAVSEVAAFIGGGLIFKILRLK